MSDKKEDRNNANPPVCDSQDIKKAGILKKLKTMKKKYFVLRTESSSGPARLEYYDNEKKFKAGVAAKRSIAIKTCFNINRKVDAKQKFAIALYTKDDSFSVVADNEESVEEWLNAMLELQLDGPCLAGGAKLKPKFEHVWQVIVGDKSIASLKNIKGLHRLCLTPSSLTLIKVDQRDPSQPDSYEFPLMGIRRCGHTNNYFVIELGRSACTGPGELWLETEDVVIAQNMHEVTLNAMKSSREHEDICPLLRPRSASNSENSRPITSRPRPVAVVSPQAYTVRDRCDSLPSRPRTISEGQEANNRGYYAPQSYMDSLRPYGGFNRTVSYSPPTINPLSPVSATCSTDSAGSSLSIDEFDGCQQTDFAHGRYIHNLPTDGALHTEPPIKEEQLDDYVPMSVGNNNNNTEGYISMAPTMMSSSAPARPSIFLHLNSVDSAHKSSLPPTSQTNDYMEMKSPMDGYINMSPIGANLDVQSSSPRDSSLNGSSQTNDGYIHMAPVHNHGASPQQHEGYLDMAPLSSSLPKTFSVSANPAINLSSRKDSNSKLSDTAVSSPSSTNLEDFPLDKVKSFLADADDASFDSYIRPVRAYSMGSRPQPKKSHLSLQVDGSRIRAYSVGSQAQRKISNPLDKEIGNLMKIDPRTGAKSSSAPLLNNRPPRIRSSASRSEVGEDLMEIDYNKTKYSTGIDLSDSFTIEPVGRARSGSYSSSSNNVLKLLHNRDKMKSQSTGHSSNSVKDDADNATDYLTMSPLNDQGKSRKNSSSTAKSDLISKKLEILHPPGDYVSLDPSCTYISGDKFLAGANNNISERTKVSPINQDSKSYLVTSISSKVSASDNESKSATPDKESDNDAVASYSPQKVENQSSDYMCMNYKQNLENKESNIEVLLSSNSYSLHSPSSLETEECESSTVKNALQDKQLHPVSPLSKTASSIANSVPKTPPPSPSYGPSSNSFSTLPLVDNVVRRLSQPTNASSVQPISNCGEIRLNYASLDLPPASEEDSRGNTTTKLKKSSEEETQDGLTYAQIDFSLVRQKAFQESDNSSNL